MPSLFQSPRQRHNAPRTTQAPPPAAPNQPAMSSAFVSKSRRVRFDLTLRILDLNNVPLVSGTSSVKWHLPSSTAAEHRGRTGKCAIRDHRVAYDYEKRIPVRLTVGKDGMLQECSVDFEVLQEYGAGGRGERIRLGDVKLNLAEYVEAGELQTPISPGGAQPGEEGIVRRYLMQESKINSTLKIGIHMRHMEGTRDYYAPTLRTAPVFGGIAGIIHSEPAAVAVRGAGSGAEPAGLEGASDGQDAAMHNFKSRDKEAGEMQDMYRRTLAAFWVSQPGELRADECIEDIFAGGDGWGKNGRPSTADGNGTQVENGGGSNSRPGSGSATPNMQDTEGASLAPPGSAGGGSTSRGMLGRHRRKGSKSKPVRKGRGEVDENEVRDDLISWRIGERASSTI